MTLDPEVFVRAAERIDDGQNTGACIAIHRIAFKKKRRVGAIRPYIDLFGGIFRPKSTRKAYWLHDRSLSLEQQKNRRVIALLLAAEMAKDGGV